MKTIFSNILRSMLVVGFIAVMGVAYAQAQFGPTFGSRFPDCSGNGFVGQNVLVAVGLTSDQRLICFRADDPAGAVTIGQLSGFVGGETSLIGIDFRAFDNGLYGVGNNGNVYRVNQQTAALTYVNTLTVALDGNRFGVDFNPTVDRLRIISATGQNLRHNLNPGGTTIADGTLNYAMVTATGVTGAAYTNNDNSPSSATTLYDIDARLEQLVTQDPANSGNLNVVGPLGANTTRQVGFDIYTNLNRFGVAEANRGFASLTRPSDDRSRFFFINLSTGQATLLGAFAVTNSVEDIALPLNQISPLLL